MEKGSVTFCLVHFRLVLIRLVLIRLVILRLVLIRLVLIRLVLIRLVLIRLVLIRLLLIRLVQFAYKTYKCIFRLNHDFLKTLANFETGKPAKLILKFCKFSRIFSLENMAALSKAGESKRGKPSIIDKNNY